MLAVGAAVAAVVAGGCGDGDRGGRPEVVVSAASSLKAAFAAYGAGLEDATARFSFAGSDELAAQIRQGVRPDVYAAADTALPRALAEEGLVGEPVVFAANELVLAVPAGSRARRLEDVAGEGSVLVVGSASVPVGRYTREVLGRLPGDLGERLLSRVRSNEPDVGGVVGKLVQGAADAGFVYATDVAATDGALRAIELPPGARPEVAYAAAVVEGAEHPEAARAFVEGLRARAGIRALRDAGFLPPPGR